MGFRFLGFRVQGRIFKDYTVLGARRVTYPKSRHFAKFVEDSSGGYALKFCVSRAGQRVRDSRRFWVGPVWRLDAKEEKKKEILPQSIDIHTLKHVLEYAQEPFELLLV